RLAVHLGIPVSASHQILPEFREYERCSTTVVNAYLRPVMQHYLQTLATELHGARLNVMRSNGGVMSAARAHQEAVHTVLSGPAGGVVGAFCVAREAGYDRAITFDMGGTSTRAGSWGARCSSMSPVPGRPLWRLPTRSTCHQRQRVRAFWKW